jgi:chemotaxis response regulator CheB
MKQLGDVCKWLYGDKRDRVRPLIESQNPDLAVLDEVLQNDAAIDTLRNGLPLKVAHDVSRGDERIFRESLQEAKRVLQTALGTLTTGFQKEDSELMRTATQICELADDILDQMERKCSPRRRRRSGGEE